METENNNPKTPEQPELQPQLPEKVIQPPDPSLTTPQAASPLPPAPAPSGGVVTNPTVLEPTSPIPPAAVTPNVQPAGQASGQQYQPYSAPAGFSHADAMAQEKKRTRTRRLLVGSAIFVGLIALAVVGFVAYSSLLGFKTITYNNGRGNTFQLKFYSRYSVKAAQGATNGWQELASKVSRGGLYPLTVSISKGTTQKPSPSLLNCTGSGLSSALQITNTPANTTVNMCSEGQGQSANPILYLGILQSGNSYYAILVDQDVNFQQLKTSPQNAQAGLKKINLSTYNNDITTIVSSIKPLQ